MTPQAPKAIQTRLMPPREAAKYLAICEKSLWTLTKEGRLPSVRIGRSVRYDVADLDAFIEVCKGGVDR